MAIPSFISQPINYAKKTTTGMAPSPESLQRMTDKLSQAFTYASENKLKSSPILDRLAELVQGYDQGLARRTLSPSEETLAGLGADISQFYKPKDVTKDEADLWLTERAKAFKTPEDYAAQLAREADTLQGLPTLHKLTQQAIQNFSGITAGELDDKQYKTLATINPNWGKWYDSLSGE